MMAFNQTYKDSRILATGGAGFIGSHPSDSQQRQPDLSKAKALLNWEPKVALADGLKETIAYFRHSLELS